MSTAEINRLLNALAAVSLIAERTDSPAYVLLRVAAKVARAALYKTATYSDSTPAFCRASGCGACARENTKC